MHSVVYSKYIPGTGMPTTGEQDPCNESGGGKIENSLKKLICNLCETLVSYRMRLRIEGTIGLTMDDDKMMLLHFAENINKSGSDPLNNETTNDLLNNYRSINVTIDEVTSEVASEQSSTDSFLRPALVSTTLAPQSTTFSDDLDQDHDDDHDFDTQLHNLKGELRQETDSRHQNTISIDSPNSGASNSSGRKNFQTRTILDMTSDILSVKQSLPGRNEIHKLFPSTETLVFDLKRADNLKPKSAAEALKQMSSNVKMDASSEFKDGRNNSSTRTGEIHALLSPDFSGAREPKKSSGPGITNQTLLRELLVKKKTETSCIEPTRKRSRTNDRDLSQNNILPFFASQNEVYPKSLKDVEIFGDIFRTGRGSVDEKSYFTAESNQASLYNSSEYRYSKLLHQFVDAKRIESSSPDQDFYQEGGIGSTSQQSSDDRSNFKVKTERNDYDYDNPGAKYNEYNNDNF